jgi:hypothetical protein
VRLLHQRGDLLRLRDVAGHRLPLEMIAGVVAGIARGCQIHGMALAGGETAAMPGLYAERTFDLAGTIIGVVEEDEALHGAVVQVLTFLDHAPAVALPDVAFTTTHAARQLPAVLAVVALGFVLGFRDFVTLPSAAPPALAAPPTPEPLARELRFATAPPSLDTSGVEAPPPPAPHPSEAPPAEAPPPAQQQAPRAAGGWLAAHLQGHEELNAELERLLASVRS